MQTVQTEFEFEFNHVSDIRFKEIELALYVEEMVNRFGPALSTTHIVNMFQLVSDLESQEIVEALEAMSLKHFQPQKHEIVLFFLFYKKHSQYLARKFTNLSPNFIQKTKEQFEEQPHQVHPQNVDVAIKLHPVYLELKNLLEIYTKINY